MTLTVEHRTMPNGDRVWVLRDRPEKKPKPKSESTSPQPEPLAAPPAVSFFDGQVASLRGVKAVEDEYADEVVDVYRRALADALRDAEGSVQVNVWHEAVNRRFAAARDEALLLSERMVSSIYANALIEESHDLPRARFEQVDAAVLDRIAGPEAFTQYLAGFDREARDAVIDVIVRRFAEPAGLDLKAMVNEMRDATEAAAWRLERIARTETTRVVNEARAAQWEKYADPSAAEYEWLTAEDERVDGRCKEIADGNPWRLEDLRLETNGFVVHPNCRCVAIRRPGLGA
jgi:SPP1 gp7 family putative phage head morphogenesis protein